MDRDIVLLNGLDMTQGQHRYWWPGKHGAGKGVKMTIKEYPRRDGGVATRKHLKPRPINLDGYVFGNNREDASMLMSNLRGSIRRNSVEVGANFAEGLRFWTCHLVNVVDKSSSSTINHIPNMLQLIAPTGWGFSNTDRDLITSATGLADASLPVTVETNYNALPTITITINSAASGDHDLTIGNGALFAQLSTTTPLAANDVLVINSFDRVVTRNGNRLDAPGLMPFFEETGETLDISSDKTINFDVSGSYRSLWI